MSFDRSSGYCPRFRPDSFTSDDPHAAADRELIDRAKQGRLDGVEDYYPVRLSSGDWVVLPMRPLSPQLAIAYFKADEMPFTFLDSLAQLLASEVEKLKPDVVAGIATQGLFFADRIARALGHDYYVPFGNTAKPWFEEELSEPLEAVTSKGMGKRLWIEPFIVAERIRGKRIAIVDDGMCTGKSMLAAMRLTVKCGGELIGIAGLFTESLDWQKTLKDGGFPQFIDSYIRLCHLPMFAPDAKSDRWVEQEGT